MVRPKKNKGALYHGLTLMSTTILRLIKVS